MKKKLTLGGLGLGALFFLAACSKSNLTKETPGIWNQIVYWFAEAIRFLSFNGSVAIGIILMTIIVRTILLPLMNIQIKSSRKMQELQPQIKAIQAKYPSKDNASRRLVQEETQRLYAENKVNPYAGCLPLIAQLPILWALYQALANVGFLHQGHFLWFDIGAKDSTFILPLLAAIFTFLSSYLNMLAAPERNNMTLAMTIIMPVLIFIMAMNLSSGISLYWVISNAYQAGQTLVLNNPFQLRAQRQAKEDAIKNKAKAKERALKKARKK